MVKTTPQAFDEGLRKIFHRATVIRTRTVNNHVEELWTHIEFKIGQISSDYNYLDFNEVDKLAKELGYVRGHFYNSARIEVEHGSFTNVHGVVQLTFSFHRRHHSE